MNEAHYEIPAIHHEGEKKNYDVVFHKVAHKNKQKKKAKKPMIWTIY